MGNLFYEKLQEESESENEIIKKLKKMSPMIVTTAYLYALNFTLYGEDVTEKWLTATQNNWALEKAYRKGYYDAMERQATDFLAEARSCAESEIK